MKSRINNMVGKNNIKPKLALIPVLAFLFIGIIFAGTAYSGTGSWPNANYKGKGLSLKGAQSQSMGDVDYDEDLVSSDKHIGSGYLTGTNFCKNCHAVHNAGPRGGDGSWEAGNSYKLLRYVTGGYGSPIDPGLAAPGTRAVFAACLFCHRYPDGIIGGFAIYQFRTDIYGNENKASHRLGATAVPDSDTTSYDASGAGVSSWKWDISARGIPGLDCLDCHRLAPHGKDPTSDETPDAIYKLIPRSDTLGQNGLFDICGRCHNRNKFRDVVVGAVITYDQATHPNIQNSGEKRSGRTGNVVNPAAFPTVFCRNCHKEMSNAQNIVEGDFPHTGRSARFLLADVVGNTVAYDGLDKLCLTCHRWGSSGVGITF